jgi:FHS family glucose/mannose:H+ symporter-like MFS transporter
LRAIYLASILNGIATTMLGPLMPGFEERWKLEDAQGGLLFVAQFLMSVLSAAATAKLARRFGYWRVVAIGMAVAAAGVLGCAGNSWTVTLLSVGVYGCGIGVITPASNVGIASAAKGDSARPVMWLNLVWSIGAVGAPTLVALLKSWFLPSLCAAFVLMAIAVALAGPGERPVKDGASVKARRVPHLLFASMLFLYVGAEQAIAGWVSSYAHRSAGSESLWAVLPSVFWGSMLVGRLIAPNLPRRVRAGSLALWGLGIALGGALLLVAGGGPLALLAGSSIAGVGFSPIFPLVVAGYADRAGASASGLVFSAAGLGGATVPWLVGTVSTAAGSLRMGLVSVIGLVLAMLWLTRIAMPRSGRSA